MLLTADAPQLGATITGIVISCVPACGDATKPIQSAAWSVQVDPLPCSLIDAPAAGVVGPAPKRALITNSMIMKPYQTSADQVTVIYDFTRFFFNWKTPCQESFIDSMITEGLYFKINAPAGVTLSTKGNNIVGYATGDIAANSVLSVSYCHAGTYNSAGTGACTSPVTSNSFTITADCTALYPKAASSVTITQKGAFSLVSDTGSLFKTCAGAQPTSVASSANALTCTVTTTSDKIVSVAPFTAVTGGHNLNGWTATFTASCSQKGSTTKYVSSVVTAIQSACVAVSLTATSTTVAAVVGSAGVI